MATIVVYTIITMNILNFNLEEYSWGNGEELDDTKSNRALNQMRCSLTKKHVRLDRRQEYVYMMLNSWNSGDANNFDAFFGKYSAPNVDFICACPKGPHARFATKFAVYGGSNISRALSGFFSQFPDVIVKLLSTKLNETTRSQSSELVFTTRSEGTQLTELCTNQLLPLVHILSRKKVSVSDVKKAATARTGPRFTVLGDVLATKSKVGFEHNNACTVSDSLKRKLFQSKDDDNLMDNPTLSRIEHTYDYNSSTNEQSSYHRPFKWDHTTLDSPLDTVINSTMILSLDSEHRIKRLEVYSMVSNEINKKDCMYPFKGPLP